MIALGTIIVLIIYILIALGVATFIKRKYGSRKAFWLTLLIFFLIPTADNIIGRSYYKYLCETRSGIKVYKVVSVEGFRDATDGNPATAGYRLALGYGYMEMEDAYDHDAYGNKTNHLFRYSLDENGKLQKKPIQNPASEYIFYKKKYHNLPFGIINDQYIVENRVTGKRLGVSERFSYHGGWVAKVFRWIGIRGGALCPSGVNVLSIAEKTLPPVKNRK